ncbi:MAG TPA: glycosyltransferase family 2 protein [Acidimicrobiales bacterium]|nr:glycosyltransferase family 2 protein [Acidimicrobiales bacterium]
MSTEPQAVAPPVVAVVVTADAGPWLEEALAALADQDYPNFSVLVIDAGAEDPTPRVAAVLPTAYVRRLPERRGYASAANEVLQVVEGASHLLFCHDDVAPAPDAVRQLVEEAFRSNAGVVAPKLVDWHDPARLLQVGMGADKSGAPAALVERGELDQEQHDAVRDVFVAPGGCTLVRADLFATLGGFDEGMELYGEDLDLSWRAQVAGARVIVAPAARVRHLEALSSGRRGAVDVEALRRHVRPLQLRHRLRAVLKNYSLFHLVRVLPQVALLAVAEMVYGLATGHVDTTRDIARAWRWNLAHRGDLRAARRQVKRIRALPDGEVRRLQARGSARFTAYLRGQLAADGRFRRPRRGVRGTRVVDDALRLRLAVVGAVALVLLVGSRHLLAGGLAAVGELAPFPDSPFSLLSRFVHGHRSVGLGAESPAPPAFALLGLAGGALLGATGLLRTLLVLGAFPVGLAGVFRLVAPLGSTRARLAALVVYAAVPLPYNAVAQGRGSGLLAYAALPWAAARIFQATGREPFGTEADRRLALQRHVLPLGLLLAVVGAFSPGAALVVVVVAVAVGSARAVVLALAAVAVAAGLLFPWSLDLLLPGSEWGPVLGVDLPAARGLGLGALLRFETGPLGAPPLGWAFVAVAALALIVGRGWRLSWATRCWVVALAGWGLAWAGGRDWLPVGLPGPEVLVAPAALGLAMAAALGMAAFELDLPGYRFGWRQAASLVAAGAALVGTVPVLGAAVDGRWHQPDQDFAGVLSWMADRGQVGSFRVLWLGDPDALPLPGWQLTEGVAYATSDDGPPDVTDGWPPASSGTAGLLADAVDLALHGETTKLGRLLAPAAVRYVVVPSRAASLREPGRPLPPLPGLVPALDAQVDLRRLESDEALAVYENAAWLPRRAVLGAEAAAASREPGADALLGSSFSGSAPLGPTVPDGSHVYLAEASSSRWQLEVGGRQAPRRTAFGWANAWTVERGGDLTLRYRTSPLRWGAIVIEVLAWVIVARVLVRRRWPAGARA